MLPNVSIFSLVSSQIPYDSLNTASVQPAPEMALSTFEHTSFLQTSTPSMLFDHEL